jgi:hypothetical protein
VQYILFIYHSEADYARRTEEQNLAISRDYMKFTEDIRASGHFRAGDRLQPVATATTVRVKDGKVLKTDGPFAETREQLGGYYIVEAKDLDEATMIAAKMPGARLGCIEVRPIVPMAQINK